MTSTIKEHFEKKLNYNDSYLKKALCFFPVWGAELGEAVHETNFARPEGTFFKTGLGDYPEKIPNFTSRKTPFFLTA